MATSGSFDTSGYKGRYLHFAWNRTGYSIDANTSTISWSLTGAGTGSSEWYMSGAFYVKIDGNVVYSSSSRIQLYNGTTVASGSITLPHNSDGTKSFSAYAEAGVYTYAVNCSGSGSFTIDTIPRATTPTIGAVTLESATTINCPRASSSFTHKLTYTFGYASGTIATNVGTSCSWTPLIALAHQIPSSVSGTGYITCQTYNGDSLIGTKTISFTASVPSSVVPTCSLTNSVYNPKFGVAVKGISSLDYAATASGIYSSTIKSYLVSFAGQTVSGASGRTGIVTRTGTLTPVLTVTDTRGRTATANGTDIVCYDYSDPSISGVSYKRGTYSNNSWSTDASSGADLKVSFYVSIASVNNLNTVSGTVTCTGETDKTYSGTGSHTLYFKTIGTDETREVSISATDGVGTTTSYGFTVTTVKVPLNINFGGLTGGKDGICIGGIATEPEVFDCKWPIKMQNKSIYDVMYPVGSVYMSKNPTSPETLFGGTWQEIKDRFLLGVGSTYGANTTGGEAEHTLTNSELPRVPPRMVLHSEGGSDYSGSGADVSFEFSNSLKGYTGRGMYMGDGKAHNNMPPYQTVYMWVRLTLSDGTIPTDNGNVAPEDLGVDYIVDSGTNGIWTYEKMASGAVKCWGKRSKTGTFTTSWGSGLYYNGGVVDYESYPFLINDAIVNVNVESSSSLIIMSNGARSSSRTYGVQLCRGTAATTETSYTLNWSVQGKWK